jgi:hypothetical protein
MSNRFTPITFLFIIIFGYSNLIIAQSTRNGITDTTLIKSDSTLSEKSHFKFDINYVNNSIYLGRADSLTLPYITPTIGYFDKSGFYISASVGYLTSSTSKKIDYYSFDAGYEFDVTKKMSGSVTANKCIYQEGSKIVSSDVRGSLSASLTYDFNYFELNTGLSASFANKTDIGIDATISRSFYFGTDDKLWTITPKAMVNLSTLYFYEGYTSRSFSIKKLNTIPNIISVTSVTKVAQNKLTLMDIELFVPISYDEKKWGVYCTPTLALPQNPIYTNTTSTFKPRNGNTFIKTEDSTPESEKNLSSRFFIEAGIYFKF